MLSVFLYGAVTALIVMVSFFSFAWAIEGSLAKVLGSSAFCLFAGVAAAIGSCLVARFTGPTTIRDTLWAMLDTEAA
jgi:hypothetical protein